MTGHRLSSLAGLRQLRDPVLDKTCKFSMHHPSSDVDLVSRSSLKIRKFQLHYPFVVCHIKVNGQKVTESSWIGRNRIPE